MTRAILLLALSCSSAEPPTVTGCVSTQKIWTPTCLEICALNGYGLAGEGEPCEFATECRTLEAGETVDVTRQAWMQPATDWDFEGWDCQ